MTLRSWSMVAMFVFVCPNLASAQQEFQPRKYDWPQWQGPNRDAKSKEKGLLQQWPKGGPKLLWKVTNLGEGYSTPSIAAGRIFTMGNKDGDESIFALKEKDGSLLWTTKVGPAVNVDRKGTRSTPTIDGELGYAIGAKGTLVCFQVKDGKIVWRKNLMDRQGFGGRDGNWGYSESVLIDGEKLICTPGGPTATIVALNKKNGELIWKCPIEAGYRADHSSAIVAEVDGLRTYIQFLGRGRGQDAGQGAVVGVRAKDGKLLWEFNAPGNRTANISTPIFHDNYVFAASAYRTGCALAKLTRKGDDVNAEKVYFSKNMQNHHGGMILLDGYVYGSNGGRFACIEFKSGKTAWEEKGRLPGKGSVAFADGRLYFRNERKGTVHLIEPSPKKYIERGVFLPPDRSRSPAWAHPVIANGRMYIADQNVLMCYDVKGVS